MFRKSSVTLLWTAIIFLQNSAINAQKNNYGGSSSGQHNVLEMETGRRAKSEEILKYMNMSVDPCTDFYDFACGNWFKYNGNGLQRYEIISPQNIVERTINRELQKILEDPKSDNLSTRKVKEFYKACKTASNPSESRKSFVMEFLKRHGGLEIVQNSGWKPNIDWVQVIALLRANYGMDILIGLEIDMNLSTMRGNSIYLDEPKSTLIPPEYCSAIAAQQADLRDRVYEDIQNEVAENLLNWLPTLESDARRTAGDIVKFEFELCKQMRTEHSLPDTDHDAVMSQPIGQNRLHGKRYQQTYIQRQSLQELTRNFDGIINFQHFVDISFQTKINDHVFMRSEAYFRQLKNVVKVSSRPTIASYIIYRALEQLSFPKGDHMAARSKYCVENIQRYFPKIIGAMYQQKIERPELRRELENLFNEIIKTFEQFLHAESIDENDQRAARQKLQQFKLSFPNYENLDDLTDLHFERLDYWGKLEEVLKYNAKRILDRLKNGEYGKRDSDIEAHDVRVQLQPMDSTIATGWGLLQSPSYKYYFPKSLKFALLGPRIARELVMAFDEQGLNQNLLSTMHWTDRTMQAYRNSSECFRTQLSNYLYNNPDVFRNASKLREFAADSTSLNIAFSAYLNWLESMDTKHQALFKETLPDLNFTNTQLFFIYFAQTRCIGKNNNELPRQYLPMDRHTLERFNVNGPLSNCVEFAREFGCTLGAEINPDDKCTFY